MYLEKCFSGVRPTLVQLITTRITEERGTPIIVTRKVVCLLSYNVLKKSGQCESERDVTK